MSDQDKLFINGPVNVARLEGDVYGIKKILYVFMDVHNSLVYQTECPTLDSIDIHHYLNKMLKDSKNLKLFDLFAEVRSSNLKKQDIPIKYKEKYIHEVIQYVQNNVGDNKNKNNITVRYHYFDFRDVLYENLDKMMYNILNIIDNSVCKNYLDSNMALQLISDMMLINNTMRELYEYIYDKKPNSISDYSKDAVRKTDADVMKKIKHFVDKINAKYTHKETRKNLDILFQYLHKYFDITFELSNKITTTLSYLYNGNTDSLTINVHKRTHSSYVGYGPDVSQTRADLYVLSDDFTEYYNNIIVMFTTLVDIFLLRRFIDKDYITHAMTYTGIAHSVNYIYTLVNHFDFKITHISKSSEPNIDKLNEKLKKKTDKIEDLFIDPSKLLFPEKLIQCSDMTNFPKGFL